MVHITWQQIRNDQACPSKKQKEACRLMMKSTGRTSGMDGCVKQAQDFLFSGRPSVRQVPVHLLLVRWSDTRPIQSFRYEDASSVSQPHRLSWMVRHYGQQSAFRFRKYVFASGSSPWSPAEVQSLPSAPLGGSYSTFHHYSVSDKIWRLKELNKWHETH